MKQTVLNMWQENRTLSTINHKENMVEEMKLSVIQNFGNLIFMITMMLAF